MSAEIDERRRPEPIENPAPPALPSPSDDTAAHDEERLDEALVETLPLSDPIAVNSAK